MDNLAIHVSWPLAYQIGTRCTPSLHNLFAYVLEFIPFDESGISGVYSIMSMKQLASSAKLGELKKVRVWLLGENYFLGLQLVL